MVQAKDRGQKFNPCTPAIFLWFPKSTSRWLDQKQSKGTHINTSIWDVYIASYGLSHYSTMLVSENSTEPQLQSENNITSQIKAFEWKKKSELQKRHCACRIVCVCAHALVCVCHKQMDVVWHQQSRWAPVSTQESSAQPSPTLGHCASASVLFPSLLLGVGFPFQYGLQISKRWVLAAVPILFSWKRNWNNVFTSKMRKP